MEPSLRDVTRLARRRTASCCDRCACSMPTCGSISATACSRSDKQFQYPDPGGVAQGLEEFRLQLVQRRAHPGSLPPLRAVSSGAPVAWPSPYVTLLIPGGSAGRLSSDSAIANLSNQRGSEARCGSAGPAHASRPWPGRHRRVRRRPHPRPGPPRRRGRRHRGPDRPGRPGRRRAVPACPREGCAGCRPGTLAAASSSAWTSSTPTAAACPGSPSSPLGGLPGSIRKTATLPRRASRTATGRRGTRARKAGHAGPRAAPP